MNDGSRASNTKVLKTWYGCTVPDGSSFSDVYVDFSSGNLDQDLSCDTPIKTPYYTPVNDPIC